MTGGSTTRGRGLLLGGEMSLWLLFCCEVGLIGVMLNANSLLAWSMADAQQMSHGSSASRNLRKRRR
jgi:uncharacterized membrane protein